MYGRGGFGREAPIRVGEEFDVKIESVGEKGDGVARVQGFVLFVPGVKSGDEVRVKVTRVSARFGFAEVVGSEGEEESEEAAPAEGEEEAPAEEAPAEGAEAEEAKEAEQPVDTENFGE